MKKLFFFTIALILISIIIIAQTTLAQTVNLQARVLLSSNNTPIDGAKVIFIKGNTPNDAGNTDPQGLSGTYPFNTGDMVKITASKTGFTDASRDIQIQPNTTGGIQIVDIFLGSPTSPSFNTHPRFDNIPTQFIEENDGFQDRLVDLWDYAGDDQDNASQLRFNVVSQSNSGLIHCFLTNNRHISCNEPDEDETGTNRITVEARDSSGLTDTESFSITVEDNFFDENDDFDFFCQDIQIENDEITILEGRTTNIKLNVFNENSKTFRVNQVSVTESSPDYSAQPLDDDFSIRGNNDEEITLRLIAHNVSETKESKIKIRINGEFSNGQDCTIGDIVEEINVTVKNSSTENRLNTNLFPQTLELLPGETKTAQLTIENEFSSSKCIEIELTKNSNDILTSIEDDSFCIRPNDSREIDLLITASSNASTQNASIQIKSDHPNGTKFNTLNIKINQKQQAAQRLEITNSTDSIVLTENQTKQFTLTISNNTENDFTNIAITMQNLPTGIFFEPEFITILPKGTITTIITTISSDTQLPQGTFKGLLEVSSDQGKTTNQITITVPENQTQQEKETTNQTESTGLATLLESTGTIFVMLLLLVLVIVLIVALLTRKTQ